MDWAHHPHAALRLADGVRELEGLRRDILTRGSSHGHYRDEWESSVSSRTAKVESMFTDCEASESACCAFGALQAVAAEDGETALGRTRRIGRARRDASVGMHTTS